ncbi:hypothetical protein [Streptomyces chilikensis]|uniref:hypothetical protein n=1 Tax=Streptomyces chilikensis TaxID=1194079 RepID=UPI003B849EAD
MPADTSARPRLPAPPPDSRTVRGSRRCPRHRPEPGEALVTRLEAHGGRRVTAHNPYRDHWGVTVEDPDGYRLVLPRGTGPTRRTEGRRRIPSVRPPGTRGLRTLTAAGRHRPRAAAPTDRPASLRRRSPRPWAR